MSTLGFDEVEWTEVRWPDRLGASAGQTEVRYLRGGNGNGGFNLGRKLQFRCAHWSGTLVVPHKSLFACFAGQVMWDERLDYSLLPANDGDG